MEALPVQNGSAPVDPLFLTVMFSVQVSVCPPLVLVSEVGVSEREPTVPG